MILRVRLFKCSVQLPVTIDVVGSRCTTLPPLELVAVNLSIGNNLRYER